MDGLLELEAQFNQTLADKTDPIERETLIRQYIQKAFDNKDRPQIEFPSNFEWPNLASEPLTLEKHLTGRITILDFFTYCCINCLHILPELEELEAEFPLPDLLVVGVHSAKFENERKSENIGNAASRYNIHHPVVNDPGAMLWSKMEVVCWPTILILDPSGRPLKYFMGEGKKHLISEFLKVAFSTFREMNLITATIDSVPRLIADGTDCVDGKAKFLKFPGKIAADDIGERLFVSDSGHNRVLTVNIASGNIESIIGDGVQGFRDGSMQTARFSSQQGLCFVPPDELYVCDTGNHSVRLVNFREGNVSTLAGNGKRGNDFEGGNLTDQTLSSPWDICQGYSPGMWQNPGEKTFDVLYIAMAGTHQIWAHALTDVQFWKGQQFPAKSFFRVAGSGAEENRNTSYPAKAAFAQPSGITFDRTTGMIYIADSESSSIRSISVAESGTVKGVCGGSKNPMDLFSYGDKDGRGCDARLQHPLAVKFVGNYQEKTDGALIVADSYNHKLKLVTELKTKNPVCTTLDLDLGSKHLNEPSGICLSADGQTLYICDTNNHSIKVVDLKSLQVTSLTILEIPMATHTENHGANSLSLPVQVSAAGGTLDLDIQIVLPHDTKLNLEAPSKWTIKLPNDLWSTHDEKLFGSIASNKVTIRLKHNSAIHNQSDNIGIHFDLFLCNTMSAMCSVDRRSVYLTTTFKDLQDHNQKFDIKLDLSLKDTLM